MGYMRHEETGAGAIDIIIPTTGAWLLDEVRIHLQAASAAENFTVQIDAAAGHQYDTILNVVAMSALVDASYLPTRPRYGLAGDKIRIIYPNASTVEYGLTVIWRSA